MAGHTLPTAAIRDALYTNINTALSGVTGITVTKKRVDEDTACPYVYIGEFTNIFFGNKTSFGNETTATIHFHSDHKTSDECHSMVSAALASVTGTNEPDAVGFNDFDYELDSENVIFDTNEKTWHGILTLRILSTGNNRR